MLSKAIVIATRAHRGQLDKAGRDYILHPLRVMLQLETEDEMIAGVLHDTVEDTKVTYEHLVKEGFSSGIIEALECLTRLENESYSKYIDRLKNNKLSRAVKIADLRDNMDLSRIENPTKEDYDRNKKYEKALKRLLKEN